jgi:phospholipid transport system substrate-binding protein
VAELVDSKVLPHFDFVRMTQLALAVNWRRATPEQQKVLTQEFRTLLVRTYSTALSSYRDQVVDFKPIRSRPEDTEVTVRTEVKQRGAQPIPIDYEMEKTQAGWKVFDVKVGGVSLITTYKDDFASQIREAGVDGLIKTLSAKNRQADVRAKSS